MMISTAYRHVLSTRPLAILFLLSMLVPGIGLPQTRPSKAEYKKIFSAAITKSLMGQKGNNICLPLQFSYGGSSDSYEISQKAFDLLPLVPNGQAAQFKALEDAGLVTSSKVERTINNSLESFIVFRKTDKGNRFSTDGKFCYAHAALKDVTKWKGPAIFGEYQIAWVYFTTTNNNVADWVTLPSVLAAFPTAKSTLQDEPDKVRQILIDLSSEGWEVNEFSKYLQLQ